MIRGQSCLYVQRTDAHGWTDAGGVGIMEAPVGTFQSERVLSLTGVSLGSALTFVTGQYSYDKVADHGEEIADYVRHTIWPRTRPESGYVGGGILFRNTRLPSSPGHEVMIFSICLYAPAGSLQNQKLYSVMMAGALGRQATMVLHDPVDCPLLAKPGIGMASLLKQPAWGWSEEKIALQSTMHLDTIDESMELRRLLAIDALDDQQKSRIETLRRRPAGGVIQVEHRNPEFVEFLRRMKIEPPFDDWTKPVTADQLATQSEQASRIVREMRQESLSA